MRNPTVALCKVENYLAMARNSARGENRMFQNLFADVDGVRTDIVDGGALACSFFLSAVLYLNKLIDDMHSNMAGLERDLERNGWTLADEPRAGAVLIWEPRQSTKERAFDPTQLHAGIYVGNDRAVSNGSNTALMPEEHHWTYDGARKVLRIWRHPILGE